MGLLRPAGCSLNSKLRYNSAMRPLALLVLICGLFIALGCQKPEGQGDDGSVTTSQPSGGGGDVTPIGPAAGNVTPVTSPSLDSAAGGGVNSAAMKKAKGIAANGIGSVNNAQKQGYGETGE